MSRCVSFWPPALAAGSRRQWLALGAASLCLGRVQAAEPDGLAAVPPGTRLVVADQNEVFQTLLRASGVHKGLATQVQFANFQGGPAILEAFRAGALDLALVGSTPPIQAHAAGEDLPIVAARKSTAPDYTFVLRPGLDIQTLQAFRGKKIAYAEGTGRQPFVLSALKQAGLSTRDVKLVPLRAGEFATAVRTSQVDIAALVEPHTRRYLRDFADENAKALPPSAHQGLPTQTAYLYARRKALSDPAKRAAIREVVQGWITAGQWQVRNPREWVQAYHVKQGLSERDGLAIVEGEGAVTFPLLRDLVAEQQATIDLIHAAGDLPRRLDAREEFDFRFDAVIAAATRR
ncbi:MAG: ABC transporter substrate-binding protein [Burkholderiaceae bacterium]|nr:ABC transporter substrate-binding protein [Burkholderiaceae bacterium]